MKSFWMLLCCVAFAATLSACKGKTPAPAESEPAAAAAAEGQASPDRPETKVVRRVPTRVEVDTSAPANVGTVPEDAKRSESGLAWVVLQEGAGDQHPTKDDIAVMNFIGWTADGKLLNESLSRGVPGAVPVGVLFPGWAEGVQLMVPGEKRRLWIPANLAFGEPDPAATDSEDKRPKGMLVYDVELVEIRPLPPTSKVTPAEAE